MEQQNELVVILAMLNDEVRASELLDQLDGPITTVEQAGAALQLYCLGTGKTMEEVVEHLLALENRDGPNQLSLQWLQENHPELF